MNTANSPSYIYIYIYIYIFIFIYIYIYIYLFIFISVPLCQRSVTVQCTSDIVATLGHHFLATISDWPLYPA